MRSSRPVTISALLLFTAAASAQVQIGPEEIHVRKMPYLPPAEFSLRAETNVVEVPAVVRDGGGVPVPNLTRKDFEILDNDRKQEVMLFSVHRASGSAGAQPDGSLRHVALLFDDMIPGSPPNPVVLADMGIMKTEARRYISQGLEPGDRISIFGMFEGQTGDFTTDRDRIDQAIQNIRVVNTTIRTREQLALQKLGTMYDIINYLAKLPGRRMLVLASNGFSVPQASPQFEDVVAYAIPAGVVLNALNTSGLQAPSVGGGGGGGGGGAIVVTRLPDGASARNTERPLVGAGRAMPSTRSLNPSDVMASVAERTGGEYIHNRNDLSHSLKELIAPEVSYVLGFQPDQPPDGRYHTLKVRLPHKSENSIAARPGYFAALANTNAKPVEKTALDAEILGSDAADSVPVRITTNRSENGLETRVVAHIDLKTMPFGTANDRHTQKITYVAAVFDQSGRFIAGGEAIVDLDLRRETLDYLKEAGINCTLSLTVPAGNYRLRTIVQESEEKKFAAQSQALTAQ